ncbi:hypothetical protein LCY76_23625 [Fictibacillus sp. KIGAM418]|uniref:Uncharacterized protein n=1 Tax=Fictibacillus marinisediminis TaxID=2878389 RepID=A0A9X1XH52_9BACL|nr:hypothetical protein [Fictibacillus marinisediminis]MCK6259563.1 hypothetical protein [Fictibacillus marinisediminis]
MKYGKEPEKLTEKERQQFMIIKFNRGRETCRFLLCLKGEIERPTFNEQLWSYLLL